MEDLPPFDQKSLEQLSSVENETKEDKMELFSDVDGQQKKM